MKVEVVLAWPRKAESVTVELPDGADVADAVAAAGWSEVDGVSGYAVFGQRARPEQVLNDGDRVELLRPLQADPRDARRKRAQRRRAG
jgi:putative ubiquitin-RnfH superfamily antitoxin RatB of RatAB toxin-antitoxin module